MLGVGRLDEPAVGCLPCGGRIPSCGEPGGRKAAPPEALRTRDSEGMADNFFDERIAQSFAVKWPNLFELTLRDLAVDFLAAPAGEKTPQTIGAAQ